MIYLLYGKEDFLIEKKINEIIENEKIESYSINNYDLENDSLKDILEDADTISMFDQKKMIIVNNSYIFTRSISKSSMEQNIDVLLSYFEHPSPDTILVFVTKTENIDERKKITKQMKNQGTIIELLPPTNKMTFIKQQFQGYQIELPVMQLLMDRVGNDLRILEQECEKIKTYKGNDTLIKKEDILELTIKNVDIDIFKLIENIILKNKQKALEAYHEMLKRNEEPIKIIIMLANQFRIMYQTKELAKKGYRVNDIASILEIHPYRIKLALEKSRDFNSSVLLTYLEALADLDSQIKSGFADKTLALELFILEV